MSAELDSGGRVVTTPVVETPFDAVEQHIHRLISQAKAMRATWIAQSYPAAMMLATDLGSTFTKLLLALNACAQPVAQSGGD